MLPNCGNFRVITTKTKRITKMKLFKKRLNSEGFGHIELLTAIVVIFVVAGAGFYVFKHQHKAHASNTNYGYMGSDGRVKAYACKTYINAYGGVYSVKALFTKAASTIAEPYYVSAIRGGAEGFPVAGQEKRGDTYWGGTVAAATTNASAFYGDTVLIMVNGRFRAGGIGTWGVTVYPSTLGNC
jgi:hypothetical protein